VFFQGFIFYAAPRNHEFPARLDTGFYGQIHPFVPSNLTKEQVVIGRFPLYPEILFDRRWSIHNLGLAVIDSLHPFCDIVGIGNKTINHVCRSYVPHSQGGDKPLHEKAYEKPRIPKVFVIHIPKIAHGAVAVT